MTDPTDSPATPLAPQYDVNRVLIATDGACDNRLPDGERCGGIGFVVVHGDHKRDYWKHVPPDTTSNRCEMLAALEALEQLNAPCQVRVLSDSEYLVKGASDWIWKWLRGGNMVGRANADLWRRLVAQMRQHDVTWEWVRGHNGHPENERAHELAARGIMARNGTIPCERITDIPLTYAEVAHG